MPENKRKGDLRKTVEESPIADVLEGRHPTASEKNWAEKTLAPTLEKAIATVRAGQTAVVNVFLTR